MDVLSTFCMYKELYPRICTATLLTEKHYLLLSVHHRLTAYEKDFSSFRDALSPPANMYSKVDFSSESVICRCEDVVEAHMVFA